jgi:hypothetical protein
MSLITDTWRQLVRRRLWPVALGLLAVLAAVPVVLAREPEVAPSPAKAQPVTAGAEVTEPVVALAGDSPKDERRRVLGESKDPFTPAPGRKAKRGAKSAQAETPSTGAEAPTSSSGGAVDGSGSGSGGDSVEPVSEFPDVESTPEAAHPRHSVTVKFGDEAVKKRDIELFEALPSADDPVAIYVGVSKDGKRALFMLAETATTEGDGTCTPSPEICAVLELGVGETETIDVKDPATGEITASYHLGVVKIHKGSGKDGGASSSKTAKAGLRALQARELPYRYDARTGTVEKVGDRALEAAAGL